MPTETRMLEEHRYLTWSQALRFAGRRMIWTMCVGLSVLAIWVLGLLVAPQLEAHYFPAAGDFRLLPDASKLNDADLLAFRVAFTKNCTCRSRGRSWFFVMSDGSTVRVQAQQPEGVAPDQAGRPPGPQIGRLQILRKPAPREGVDRDGRPIVVEAEAVVGTSEYERGLPWTSQVTIGPFPIEAFRHPDPIRIGAAPPETEELP